MKFMRVPWAEAVAAIVKTIATPKSVLTTAVHMRTNTSKENVLLQAVLHGHSKRPVPNRRVELTIVINVCKPSTLLNSEPQFSSCQFAHQRPPRRQCSSTSCGRPCRPSGRRTSRLKRLEAERRSRFHENRRTAQRPIPKAHQHRHFDVAYGDRLLARHAERLEVDRGALWLSSASIVSGTRFATRPPKNAARHEAGAIRKPNALHAAPLAPNVLRLMPPMNPTDIDRFFCLASAGHAAASTRNNATAELVSVRFRTPLPRTLGR